MKKLLLILILLLSFTLIGNCAWLGSAGEWDYRIELAIGDYAGDIGDPVTWFPCTIFLKDANGDSTKIFEEIGNNYRKMAITQNDGTTELKGEIEGWNYNAGTPALSTGFIHTSADGWTINSNTSVWVYYDIDHADNANIDVTNTTPAEEVWDGFFKGVWHYANGADTSHIYDSTSNSNDGTKLGASSPAEAAGLNGAYAQEFDGNDDYITIPAHISLDINTDYTLTMVIEPDTVADERVYYDAGYNNNSSINWFYSSNIFSTEVDAGGGLINYQTDDTLAADTWQMLTFSRDKSATNLYVYVDGTKVHTYDMSGNTIVDTATHDHHIGWSRPRDKAGVQFDGKMSELRLSPTHIRSDAWDKGTYNSLFDTLFTYGSEETAPPPPVGITWNGVVITKWNGVTITIPINTQ